MIPTFNEVENLPRLLPILDSALADCGVRTEIVVADDCSPDGTAAIARDLASLLDSDVVVLERQGPRSLAASVIDGAQTATFDCVVVLDADLSHDPRDIPKLVDPILSGHVDISIASRYMPGGMISRWPLHRRLLSAVGTWPARALTRAADPLSGYFACRREVFFDSRLQPRGYKILLEILARRRRLRRAEVPTRFTNRTEGDSKLGVRQKIEFVLQLASLISARVVCRGAASNR